jgi:hypothetical protein
MINPILFTSFADLAITSFTKFPNPGDPGPMIGTAGMASQTLTLTLGNVATASGTVNDVRQATGSSDVNFAFTGYYATANGAPTAGTSKTGFGSFTISLSATDLRSEVKAAASKTFSGKFNKSSHNPCRVPGGFRKSQDSLSTETPPPNQCELLPYTMGNQSEPLLTRAF